MFAKKVIDMWRFYPSKYVRALIRFLIINVPGCAFFFAYGAVAQRLI